MAIRSLKVKTRNSSSRNALRSNQDKFIRKGKIAGLYGVLREQMLENPKTYAMSANVSRGNRARRKVAKTLSSGSPKFLGLAGGLAAVGLGAAGTYAYNRNRKRKRKQVFKIMARRSRSSRSTPSRSRSNPPKPRPNRSKSTNPKVKARVELSTPAPTRKGRRVLNRRNLGEIDDLTGTVRDGSRKTLRQQSTTSFLGKPKESYRDRILKRKGSLSGGTFLSLNNKRIKSQKSIRPSIGNAMGRQVNAVHSEIQKNTSSIKEATNNTVKNTTNGYRQVGKGAIGKGGGKGKALLVGGVAAAGAIGGYRLYRNSQKNKKKK